MGLNFAVNLLFNPRVNLTYLPQIVWQIVAFIIQTNKNYHSNSLCLFRVIYHALKVDDDYGFITDNPSIMTCRNERYITGLAI